MQSRAHNSRRKKFSKMLANNNISVFRYRSLYHRVFQFLCKFESKIHVVSKLISYFPLNCLILWAFWVRSLLSQNSSCKICDNWPSNGTSSFFRRSTLVGSFRTQMSTLNQLRIPRCVKLNAYQPWKCTDFATPANARSELAYIFAPNFNDHSELLCSKSRVAPLKTVSLPRLELSAALLLACLINKVREFLEFSQCLTYLWSDSMIALNWITSPSRWSIFVANRMDEIQRLTEIKDWRHIASSDNSIDILSRRLNLCDLINAERWWNDLVFNF